MFFVDWKNSRNRIVGRQFSSPGWPGVDHKTAKFSAQPNFAKGALYLGVILAFFGAFGDMGALTVNKMLQNWAPKELPKSQTCGQNFKSFVKKHTLIAILKPVTA